ncbi:hypothetical protein IMSHALPRED_001804 [Imshaugia aleurites]|uniref:Uncharacterized protein n=1 Tax=Imshaugia aleurites TaxID=172621 RepID=A0A8H3J3Y0_9LECA|nr:hypothetical protein IMSHALPRED_001804 [Imshaugia aleurites]
MRNPDQWYDGDVVEVHGHWRYVKIKERSTQQIFVLEPAYQAVSLELTVEANKHVNFKLKPDSEEVTEIKIKRD